MVDIISTTEIEIPLSYHHYCTLFELVFTTADWFFCAHARVTFGFWKMHQCQMAVHLFARVSSSPRETGSRNESYRKEALTCNGYASDAAIEWSRRRGDEMINVVSTVDQRSDWSPAPRRWRDRTRQDNSRSCSLVWVRVIYVAGVWHQFHTSSLCILWQ